MKCVVVRGFFLPTQSQTDRHIGVRNRALVQVPVDEDGGVGIIILCRSNQPGQEGGGRGQVSSEGGFLFRGTDEHSQESRGVASPKYCTVSDLED